MNRLPDIGQVSDLRLGDHPGFDAWFYSFCAENNIEHGINPSGVASPEQLRFMVAMPEIADLPDVGKPVHTCSGADVPSVWIKPRSRSRWK